MIKMYKEYSSTPSRGVVLCHLQADWVCVHVRHGLEQQREAYGPKKPQSYHRVYSVVTNSLSGVRLRCLSFVLSAVTQCFPMHLPLEGFVGNVRLPLLYPHQSTIIKL